MSLGSMSHVEFTKSLCRPVEFRGQGPLSRKVLIDRKFWMHTAHIVCQAFGKTATCMLNSVKETHLKEERTYIISISVSELRTTFADKGRHQNSPVKAPEVDG